MKTVRESPEHHFLTFVDKLKRDSGGWMGIRYALSRRIVHNDIISAPEHIAGKIFKLRKESDALLNEIGAGLAGFADATAYLFADCDIIVLVRIQNAADHEKLQAFFRDSSAKEGDAKLCEMHNIAKEIHAYQKLADERFLSARRMKAYEALSDANKVQSISLRRGRREDALILIVEDDRFTASYATNLLNKDYDVVHAKTGEEAMLYYIEHAPDIVLLDIHLPGLNGLETLRAIRQMDSESFVVMLSVDTVKENIVDSTASGAAGFLKKPFTKDRLLATVQKSPFVKRFSGGSGFSGAR